jgi:hypothetical protein
MNVNHMMGHLDESRRKKSPRRGRRQGLRKGKRVNQLLAHPQSKHGETHVKENDTGVSGLLEPYLDGLLVFTPFLN